MRLPLEVSGCVDTKSGVVLILHYGLSVVVWDLFRVCQNQRQDVVFFCFTHCSKVGRLRLALEVKDKRRVSKGSRSQD